MAHNNIRTKNIHTNKKNLTPDQKKKRLDVRYTDDPDEFTLDHCWTAFLVNREIRGNAKASIDAYKRFYKKLCAVIPPDATGIEIKNMPISMIDHDAVKAAFINSLRNKDGSPVSPQTVNHYLRSYRAFGFFCEDEGYIPTGFKLPIKEVEPPLKEVYTEAELRKLTREPDIEDFVAYRNYAIITLILTTGARSNTILNIKIKDFDPETGYINFNTTKTHIAIKEGLDPTCIQALRRFVERWRSFEDTDKEDYLFCNYKEEQMSRATLCKSIRDYNLARGVKKTSLHLLRHTFAKMWITDGGDIVTLAKVLTHSELEMVKRYSNLYATDVKKEIEQHSALAQLKPAPKKTLKTKAKN